MKNEIREFIIENFLFGEASDMVNDDESLMETGTIDSTGILEIIEFLEERYDVKIEDSELLPENLDTVSAITRFIDGKLSVI